MNYDLDTGNQLWFTDDPCPECGRQMYFSEHDSEYIRDEIVHYGVVFCTCGFDDYASY